MRINRKRLISERREVSADMYAYALVIAALGSRREYKQVVEAMELVREQGIAERMIAYV